MVTLENGENTLNMHPCHFELMSNGHIATRHMDVITITLSTRELLSCHYTVIMILITHVKKKCD